MPSSSLILRPPPRSTLFPYTPLFRSIPHRTHQSTIKARDALPRLSRENIVSGIDRKSTRLNSSHLGISYAVFFFNTPATTEIYTLSLHAALPIYPASNAPIDDKSERCIAEIIEREHRVRYRSEEHTSELQSLRHLVCRLLL